MAILRTDEIRNMGAEERNKNLQDLYQRLIKHRARNAAGGTIESPGEIREIKRTIARILTLNHEDKRKALLEEASKTISS